MKNYIATDKLYADKLYGFVEKWLRLINDCMNK